MNAEFACDTEPFREWWRTATAMLRSVHDAEGIVQETYLRAWRSYDEITEPTEPRSGAARADHRHEGFIK